MTEKKTEKKNDLTGLFDLPSPEPQTQSPLPEDAESEFSSHDLPPQDLQQMDVGLDIAPTEEPVLGLDATEPPNTLEQVKQFAENIPVAQIHAQSEFPFTLKITGRLESYEKNRLLDILQRENFGLREIDLEPQFEAGQILLPRISEYAGILVLQAIRSARVKVEFYPSDQEATTLTESPKVETWNMTSTSHHPADGLPITTEPTIPQVEGIQKDTVVVGARLRSDQVNPDGSRELNEAIDALTRELKYKAFYKGAKGLTQLKIETSMVGSDGYYQLTLSALTLV